MNICIQCLLLVIFALGNASFAANPNPTSIATQTGPIYNEHKLNIVVSSAQPIFKIQLKSNPTTGYSWFLREWDTNLILPVKQTVIKSSTDAPMGAPGFELFTFKVKPAAFIVPQQTTLRMVYARPWQENEDGANQLVFKISTKP